MARIIAIAGDTHCGSTTGLMPEEGVTLDDGQHVEPSKAQKWLWECWNDGWGQVSSLVGKRDKLDLVFSGDLIDGDHHRTSQIVSPLTGIHFRAAHESLRVPLALKPDRIHVLRGTPSHVGRAGEVEEGLARTLKAEGWPVVSDPDTEQVSSYRRRVDIDGVLLDIAHHGRMGQRAHTKASYSNLYAFDIWAEQALEFFVAAKDDLQEAWNNHRPADIALRAHNHKFMDSGKDHRTVTRVINLPAFQLATEYVHRIAAESLADIGILAIVIDGGEYEVHPIMFPYGRSTIIGG